MKVIISLKQILSVTIGVCYEPADPIAVLSFLGQAFPAV